MSDLVTVEHDGFTVTSNTRTADEMTLGLQAGDEAQEIAQAEQADEQAARRGDVAPDASEAGRTLNKAKRDKVQERIDKAVAAQRSAERLASEREQRATAAERRASELEARLTQPQSAPVAPPVVPSNPTPAQEAAIEALPALDQYESIEAWQRDVAAMIRKQALEDFRNEQRQQTAAQAEQSRQSELQKRIVSFKEAHPDYDAVVNAVEVPRTAPSHDALFAHLQFSEMGPQLAYYLGQHPDELHAIISRPPGFAVAALGKLEGKLEALSSPAPVTAQAPKLVISNAKPPIKPLGSSPVVADDGPDDMPFGAEYVRQMNARDRQSRRTR